MSGEWAGGQKKEKAERAMGVGRGTREGTVKWNQMTALRFQTGVGVGTSDISGFRSGCTQRRRDHT